MPSPVGHLLAGAIAYLAAKEPHRRSVFLLALACLAGILPDFDFLPGILIGDIRAFHHGISHSLAFALIFGASVFLIARRWGGVATARVSALATVSYAAHVLLDFASVNEGARGVPLLWPLSDQRFGVNLQLFGHFRYTDIRDGIWSVVRPENASPVLREFLILGGLAAALLWKERIAALLGHPVKRRFLVKRRVRPEGRSAATSHIAQSMKALVIAPQPFFSPRGTPFSVYYRTMVTAQLGVAVDLLTYGQGQDVAIPGVRIIRIPKFRFLGAVKVGPSLLKLFLDVFLSLWTIGLLLRNRYDFVHAHEEAVFWCGILKPVFRFRLVYDMHSSLPQQLTNFNFTRSRALIGMFSSLERLCLRNAEAVITICPDLRDYVLKMGIPTERHVLIENSIFDDVRVVGAAEGDLQPARSVAGAIESTIRNGGPVIAYAGTFEHYQGLDLLLSAFALVLKECPDARLLMIGGARTQVEEKRRLADRLGLNGACIFTGQVSKAQARELSGQADVLVSPRVEGTNTPLKIYEQLASGKPLVATRIWSHTQVLSDEVCILVDPEPKAMAAGILRAMGDEAQLPQVANARSLYERAYSRPAYEAKLRRLLELLP